MPNPATQEPLLKLEDVSIAFDNIEIVKRVSFELLNNEICCLLGPSGCGKSTLLRSIAGFEPLVDGNISIHGHSVSNKHSVLEPEKRGVGLVFQDLALFPHLTIAENICFGIKHWTQEEQNQRVHQLLELVNMNGVENRYPDSLSGGQQQRIALARAIAPKPKIILLDEPFSGLDAAMREQLAPEVREILLQEKISAIMVTHDQLEAFAMADKLGVINNGEILQYDQPFAIYHKPKSRFIANFIGKGKFINATVIDQTSITSELGKLVSAAPHQFKPGQDIDVLIRPDDVIHNDDSEILAKIQTKQFQGSHFLYLLELNDGSTIYCYAPSHHDHSIGEKIGIDIDLDHLVLFEK